MNQFNIIEFNEFSIVHRLVYYKGFVTYCQTLKALSLMIKLMIKQMNSNLKSLSL